MGSPIFLCFESLVLMIPVKHGRQKNMMITSFYIVMLLMCIFMYSQTYLWAYLKMYLLCVCMNVNMVPQLYIRPLAVFTIQGTISRI